MNSTKVAVVTGANRGIGFAIVKALCQKFDGIVYLTARDVKRGQDAVTELKKLGLKPKFHQLDIDDEESIEAFRDYLKQTHTDGIDCLVNNAAIAYKVNSTVPFGEQAVNTIRVNFTGTLNVCEALFPLLRANSRVVNVSSSRGLLSQVNGQEPAATELRKKLASPDLTMEELCSLVQQFVKYSQTGKHSSLGWGNSAYVASKVAIVAMTRIQQRKFDSDPREDMVVNAVYPGFVLTEMSSNKGNLTPDEGAVASVFLALLPPNVKEPRGGYVWWDKQIVDWVNKPAV